MAYIKTIWVNEETPLNEDNMNHIEEGIADNDLSIRKLQQQIEDEKVKLVINSGSDAQEEVTFLISQLIQNQQEAIIYFVNQNEKHSCLFSLENNTCNLYYISNTTLVKVNLNDLDVNHYLIIIYEVDE